MKAMVYLVLAVLSIVTACLAIEWAYSVCDFVLFCNRGISHLFRSAGVFSSEIQMHLIEANLALFLFGLIVVPFRRTLFGKLRNTLFTLAGLWFVMAFLPFFCAINGFPFEFATMFWYHREILFLIYLIAAYGFWRHVYKVRGERALFIALIVLGPIAIYYLLCSMRKW